MTRQEFDEAYDNGYKHGYAAGRSDSDALDKIRNEIDKQEKWLLQAGYNTYNVDIAFNSIKLVLAESENEYGIH